MGALRLLSAAGFRRMPWKNGGGETVEIAVFPADAGLDDFDWRISMATVAADGPFSLFPGIDRTLSVLTGAGIALAIDGAAPVRLAPESPPHYFPADAPVEGRLIGGPITDLNVMTRRGRFRHRVARHLVERRTSFHLAGDLAVLLPRDGGLRVCCGEEVAGAAAGDALTLEVGDGVPVCEPADGRPVEVYLAQLWRE